MKILLNYRFLIVLLFPFICFFIVLAIIKKPTIDICNNETYSVLNFSDSEANGNSKCTIQQLQNDIKVDFELKSGYPYPYAGIQIITPDSIFLDLTNYTFHIQIEAEQDMRMSLRFNQFLPDYSSLDTISSLLLFTKPFVFKKGDNYIKINSEDVNEIPEWWFTLNPKKTNDIKSHSLTKTKMLWLYSEGTIPLNTPISFTVKEFKLVYNIFPLVELFLLISLGYYISLLIIWKYRKETINYIIMPIEHVKVKDKNKNIQDDILSYIATNYNNSQLKISDVAHSIGVSDDTISEALKQHSNTNFRQYINKIRMEEAKHLLLESQLQISEIAFAVGYNNIQHFNRVFKEYTQLPPKTFREQKGL